VTVYALPTPEILPDTPEICNGDSVVLDAGPGYASYQWSTGESTQTINVSPGATTQYCVTVTDGNGCRNMACETVTVHALPTPDILPDAPAICNGDSIVLDAGAGYSAYLWSTGETTQTISVSPASTSQYCVTVTDGNGCQEMVCEIVIVHDLPTPDILPDGPAICNTESVVLDAGAGYTAYLWSTGETTQTINVSPGATTQYCVTVTDGNGCRNTACETVTIYDLPTPDILPDAPALCRGDTLFLDAGAGYIAYQWSTGEDTQTVNVSPDSTTQYCVTVTDGNGCRNTACETVTVFDPPAPVITPNNPALCAGDTLFLDAGAGYASYLWSTGETTQTVNLSPMQNTEICVTVTDGNGCERTACETIVVNEPAVVDILPARVELCYGESVTLDAGPGFTTYEWSTGETTRRISLTPESTQEICVNVTDPYGCETRGCRTLIVHPLPIVNILPDNPSICRTESVTLDAGFADYVSYLWNTGEDTRFITVTPEDDTIYTCTVVDAYGCVNTAQELVDVYVPDPPPSVGNTIRMVRNGGQIVFQWQGLPDTPLFRIKGDDGKVFNDPQDVKEVPGVDGLMTTSIEQSPESLVFYRTVGVNCADIEGP
jgi:cell wall-associated NlpC family hydrolase